MCPTCADTIMWPQVDPETRLEIDICPTCHGIWFDARELPVFLQSPTLKGKFMWKPDVRMSQEERDEVRAGSRQCPRCRVPMGNREYASVTVDCCPRCEGLWFDDGEVRMVVERHQRGKRSGDSGIGSDLADGLATDAGGQSAGGLFGSLRSFLKSARKG